MSDKNPAEVYEQYLGRSIADPFTRVLLQHAAPKRGERVVDLASGTGSVARHFAPLIGTEGRVVALDVSPAMLAVGAAMPLSGGPRIEWVEGDALSVARRSGWEGGDNQDENPASQRTHDRRVVIVAQEGRAAYLMPRRDSRVPMLIVAWPAIS